MKKIYVKGKNTLRKAGYTGLISAILTFIIITGAVFFAAPVLHAENITGADYEEISVDPVENKEGYSSVIYNDVNGLPTSEANAITETEEGFIWIGSYSGLIRYDGNNFERVDSVSTGITSVVSLYVDSKNRLWIGTNDNGVVVMDQGVFTHFNRTGGMKSSTIRSITEDHNGRKTITGMSISLPHTGSVFLMRI